MSARAPGFWWRPPGLMAALLSPIGALVGAITLRRMARPGESVPIPVLCIGNPTVGGAGKTPTALWCLDRLTQGGHRPFALLRGHGGSVSAPVRVEPDLHDAQAVGDEALLLAVAAPTIVAGGDRAGGARLAASLGASHIVMDDGFQNASLAKDASLLVVDAAVGVGNGAVLPAGPLRAPLAPQIARADAVLLVGEGAAGDAVARIAERLRRPVLRARLAPAPQAVAALRGRPLHAFAGIGRPEKFFETLTAQGLDLRRRTAFADHHPYDRQEIETLRGEARAANATLVTTAKDMARLGTTPLKDLAAHIAVLSVTLVPDDPSAFDALLRLAEERARTRLGAARA
ncbi:tetraacyldisaccharide 4'-kinase [Xanthobacter variabilis]|uniref:tetraacyldisaccharide 4'-kinase n=1 Tax=Xanthobacter variabilis TaxID=3119932 RepID=UPI00374F13C4